MIQERRTVAEDSERSILALALRSPEVVDEAGAVGLTVEDFGDRRLRALWAGMVADRSIGVGPDAATVLERHELDLGVGRPFPDLAALTATVRLVSRTPARRENFDAYVERLVEYRARRELLDAANDTLALHADGVDTSEIRERVETALLRLQTRSSGSEQVSVSELFSTAQARALRVRNGVEVDSQLRTGIAALDRVLRYHPGHYGLIAGRPSMGKTQLALTLADGIARRHGPVLFVSVEMGAESLGERLYSSSVFGDGDVDDQEMRAARSWDGVPLWVDYRAKSLSEVASAVRIARAKHGVVAFVVDYLQKVRLPRRDSREQEVANASFELSQLCHSAGMLGLVLSQLNRGVDSRPDKRPNMGDLRESGALEQDADSILFVYRDVVYNPTTREPHKAELILSKQRNGRAGVTVPAHFEPGKGFFSNYRSAFDWNDDE